MPFKSGRALEEQGKLKFKGTNAVVKTGVEYRRIRWTHKSIQGGKKVGEEKVDAGL